MKIEIHIRDTNAQGEKIGFKNIRMESCRVYKEPKDGLRLDNLVISSYSWFLNLGNEYVNSVKANDMGRLGRLMSAIGLNK